MYLKFLICSSFSSKAKITSWAPFTCCENISWEPVSCSIQSRAQQTPFSPIVKVTHILTLLIFTELVSRPYKSYWASQPGCVHCYSLCLSGISCHLVAIWWYHTTSTWVNKNSWLSINWDRFINLSQLDCVYRKSKMGNSTAVNKQTQTDQIHVLVSKIKREPDFWCDYIK